MARGPLPLAPGTSRNSGYAGPGADLGDPPPVAPYPIKRGGRAVPDRTRQPTIGPACGDTTRANLVEGETTSVAPRFTEELRAGVDIGPRENVKTRQEHGDAVTEARHGRATRPPRPGQWI